MFTLNDDLSIYATRGDIVFFFVTTEDKKTGKAYKFQPGDVVRIKVYGKKDAENVVLQKDFPITEITEKVDVFLTKDDMKIGDVISKQADYWYEVVLNDDTTPQTIIGYDEDGAKLFRLFPEGDDIPPYTPEIKPEDIPIVDSELDLTSTRPIENQAVARAIAKIEDTCDRTFEAVAEMYVTPQMFGAIGDGEADDTDAVQAAFDAVGENGCVQIPKGIYCVTSLTYRTNNSQVFMYGKFKQADGYTGDLLTVTGRNIDLRNLNLERDCTKEGRASEDLQNVGLKITESKNINIHCPIIKNFRVGIEIHSDTSGCAYIDIYSPQIIAYEGIKSTGAAWVNEIHTFGGRISIHDTYSDYTGSSYLNLMGDCNRIFGMCIEGTKIERKIKGGYSSSLFIGCRLEGKCESGTDIEVDGSWNAFIHNRNFNEVIADNGEGNNFMDYAVYKFNSAIAKPVATMTSTETEKKFDGNWKKPLVLADAKVANMTISYPAADNAYVKGIEFTVKKIDESSNTVYVYTRDSLDGKQISLSKQNETITFFSDGAAWRIKEHYIPA